MSSHSAWHTLGIEPTEDKRAIKRAYAARLKALEVENDPKGFIALREALDNANWEAEYGVFHDEPEDAEEAEEPAVADIAVEPISDEEISPEPVSESDEDEQEPDEDPVYWRWEPERQPEAEADQERIIQLLWGDEPVEDIQLEMVERTHAILSAPEMENIDHASAIEDWMASIIAQSIPRSDALARVAVPHFGWQDQADNWRQRYGVGAAVERFADIEARDRLEKPDHRWHEAWRLLQQPPPDQGKAWKSIALHKPQVLALLESIRFHSPGLEAELNADHVARWEPSLKSHVVSVPEERESRFSLWWIIWVVFALAQCGRLISTTDQQPANFTAPAIEDVILQNQSEQDLQNLLDRIETDTKAARELKLEPPLRQPEAPAK